MNWKTDLRAADLGDDARLKLTYQTCGAVRYLAPETILARRGGAQLFLDEVKSRARCRQRGCLGRMRMAMVCRGDASGFVGGIV